MTWQHISLLVVTVAAVVVVVRAAPVLEGDSSRGQLTNHVSMKRNMELMSATHDQLIRRYSAMMTDLAKYIVKLPKKVINNRQRLREAARDFRQRWLNYETEKLDFINQACCRPIFQNEMDELQEKGRKLFDVPDQYLE